MSSHVPKHVKECNTLCLFHAYFQVLVQHLPTATEKNSPTAWATNYCPPFRVFLKKGDSWWPDMANT